MELLDLADLFSDVLEEKRQRRVFRANDENEVPPPVSV
jgi:hypothetical protein